MFTRDRRFGESIPVPKCDPEFEGWSWEQCTDELRRLREDAGALSGKLPPGGSKKYEELRARAAKARGEWLDCLAWVAELRHRNRKRDVPLVEKYKEGARKAKVAEREAVAGLEVLAAENPVLAELERIRRRAEGVQWRQLQLVWRRIQREFPGYFVKLKCEDRFQCLVGRVGRPFNKRYATHYTTTFHPGIYVPHTFLKWKPGRIVELFDHESVHLRQYARVGGTIPYLFLYLLVPLPLLLAYFRYKWEKEAYERTIVHAYNEGGPEKVRGEKFVSSMVERLCGPEYGFTWHDRAAVRKWVLETVDRVERGDLS
ncbi:MAG: hypothetical protein Kow0069_08950 [Promethearchaeota archaeon]